MSQSSTPSINHKELEARINKLLHLQYLRGQADVDEFASLVTDGGHKFPSVSEAVLQLFDQYAKAYTEEHGYVKKKSAEWHRREMIRYKASLDANTDAFGHRVGLTDNTPGGIANMYRYHKPMYEQLPANQEPQL